MPDGKTLLFTVTKASGKDRWDKADIVLYSRESRSRKVLIQGGSDGRYVPTGHLIYARGANVLAVPFDIRRLDVTSGPVPAVEGVARALGPETNTPAAQLGLSTDGTLAYIPVSAIAFSQRVVTRIDRSGKKESLDLAPGAYTVPRLSPDGKQLAVEMNNDIWIYDLSGKAAARRLTFEESSSRPIWSPDGRYVAFDSMREGRRGIFRQLADGTAAAERLTTVDAREDLQLPTSWSSAGNTLAFEVAVAKKNTWSLRSLSITGERKTEPLMDLPGSNQRNAEFSPDGRWFAYLSDVESNLERVYVQPFPPTGAKYQISREHAHGPVWSRDGRELFYYDYDARRLVAVPVRTEPSFVFGNPVPVPIPIDGIVQETAERQFDISPDGRQFLLLQPAAGDASRATLQVNVVLNWFDALKQQVPTK